MMMIDHLLGLLAPHICLGCSVEGSVLCANCVKLYHEPLPSRCAGCHKLTEDYRVCSHCRSWLDLYAVFACGTYEGVNEQLVKSLKYELKRDAAKPMAQIMAALVAEEDALLCPVPTAPSRIRDRGFDHALHITKLLSKASGLPYRVMLQRMSNVRQVGSSRSARMSQMSSEFRLRDMRFVRGKKVIIVDDVMTTGATLAAISRVLKQAEVKRVSAVIFAQRI